MAHCEFLRHGVAKEKWGYFGLLCTKANFYFFNYITSFKTSFVVNNLSFKRGFVLMFQSFKLSFKHSFSILGLPEFWLFFLQKLGDFFSRHLVTLFATKNYIKQSLSLLGNVLNNLQL